MNRKLIVALVIIILLFFVSMVTWIFTTFPPKEKEDVGETEKIVLPEYVRIEGSYLIVELDKMDYEEIKKFFNRFSTGNGIRSCCECCSYGCDGGAIMRNEWGCFILMPYEEFEVRSQKNYEFTTCRGYIFKTEKVYDIPTDVSNLKL